MEDEDAGGDEGEGVEGAGVLTFSRLVSNLAGNKDGEDGGDQDVEGAGVPVQYL